MTECRTQQARFFVPEWWVTAYQRALAGSLNDDQSSGINFAGFDQGTGRLLPTLDPMELNFLAHILGDFQEQILRPGTGGKPKLSIQPETLSRQVGSSTPAVRNLFARLLQLIPGLRLAEFAPANVNEMGAEKIVPQSLFSGEEWSRQDDVLAGALQLAPMAAEAILGYRGSHSAFVDRINESRETLKFRNAGTPLVLWRSVWLDLNAQEQAVFLRMERAIQWDFRWLHLDGIFSENISDLCRGVKFPLTRGASAADSSQELSRCLRLLAKLGRKLISHGWLASPGEDAYLAVESGSERQKSGCGPDLVWRISPQRLNMDELQKYRSRVAEWLDLQRWPEASSPWAEFLELAVGGKFNPTTTKLNEARATPAVKRPEIATVLLGPATILDVRALHTEWTWRQQSGSKIPLPEDIAATRGAEICSPTSTVPPETAVEHLGHWLAENPEIVTLLRDRPLGTLAADISWGAGVMQTAIQGWKSRQIHSRRVGFSGLASGIAGDPAAVGGSADAAGRTKTEPSAAGASPGVPAQVQASKMRRVAIEELQRIKEGQPEQYRDLKTTFLQSLDEASRKVFAEVQARMEPRVFDEHLRQRLVKFMIDNPASWRSTSSVRSPHGIAHSGQTGQSGHRH